MKTAKGLAIWTICNDSVLGELNLTNKQIYLMCPECGSGHAEPYPNKEDLGCYQCKFCDCLFDWDGNEDAK